MMNIRTQKRLYQDGFTLVELIVTFTILAILASAAFPIARYEVRREKERELRTDLQMMRDAIDRHKDAGDKGLFPIKIDTFGYPVDLPALVKGIEIQGHKVKFLASIPIDPMTGTTEWGRRSVEDDPTSDSWDGKNVFDVYSKSQATALDGTKYSTW